MHRMTIQIETLKAVVSATDVRARAFAAAGRRDSAVASYDTLFRTLLTLLGADDAGGAPRGWRKVARRIADTRQQLSLDALTPARLGALEVRAVALSCLPDLITLDSLATIHETIRAAIAVGAPWYNSGNAAACAAAYWATLNTLIETPARGDFYGYADAMRQLRTLAEAPALSNPATPIAPLGAARVDAFAWKLRRCFDATLALRDVATRTPVAAGPLLP